MTSPALGLPGERECTGCLACVDACNAGALAAHRAEDGHLYPRLSADACNDCGRCIRTCPLTNGFSYLTEHESSPYAVWARDESLRANSASGGAFAALAHRMIQQGGYVAGAISEGIEVRHVLVNKPCDIASLQGSKYLQSDGSGIYRAVKQKLSAGAKVLFAGLPCQVAGLLSYLGHQRSDNLITADLVCFGVPSALLIDRVNKATHGAIAAVRYATKEGGWQRKGERAAFINDRGERINVPGGRDALVMKGFLSGLTNRYSCYHCPFAVARRKADLTLGDFWGLTRFPEQHPLGVSLVVSHSQRGTDLLASSDVAAHRVDWREVAPHNPRILCGNRRLYAAHPARRWMPQLLRYFGIDFLLKLYGGAASGIRWLPYKAFNYLLYRHYRWAVSKRVEAFHRSLDK